MPFGLKNAGATYQRLMNKIFEKQVGKCMEVYVDDMVIKSLALKQHLDHLEEVFGEARKHGMRFNPEKCTFGVAGGKFLGFMLSERGIEANPDKCKAIIDMVSPRNVKDVQRLTGRIAALARFLPIMVERSRPFIELLKKSQKFVWTNECEDAFVQYKHVLAAPPALIKPIPNLEMIVYLSVSDHAVSSVLLQETPEPNPVYFVSRTLQGPESRYQLVEKVVLALVYTARRLRHYFQSHRMIVRTDCPMAKILRKPELAGRLVTWTIELSQYDIHFENRRPLKAQLLADFINEFTTQHNTISDMWNLHVDGSSNQSGSGAGVILEGPNAFAIEQSIRFGFKASNNQAEYEALLAGLRLAREMGVKRITAWSDSKIVTEQVNDTYQIRDSVMLKYYQEVKKIKIEFEEVCIRYTHQNMNARADRLARLASQRKPGQLQSMVHQQIPQPSITKQECMDIENSSHNWMTPLLRYLTDGSLPQDAAAARKIKAHAAKYLLLGKELYRRGISTPMLKCLEDDQAKYVMREIHEGICGTHSGGRTMAVKVLRAGYYWPTITQDCQLFVKICIPYQQHGPHLRQHADTLRHISAPWPFAIWGMDLLGPFPLAKGQCKFLLVAVDYFTKWIEAEPLASITAHNVQKFTWKNIITRFGLPHALITDNGLQFANRRFNEFLAGLRIKHRVTSVEHLQTNGQAEAANKVILHELKRRLGSANGEWAEKLPEILWAYRCTLQTTTKETPFRLTYGTDAMVPVEIGEPSFRRENFKESANEEALAVNLDLIDEIRDHAAIMTEASKRMIARKFNSKISSRQFYKNDLVWQVTGDARKNRQEGKLAANWEGPFRVAARLNNGAYKLETLAGKLIPRTWNVTHLKHYYN
ncbi:uncharacterized protein LOC113852348 [Abrus precatorius]|uniref:Uncharacterized protein LOC113852348 n=1 Tax=Abrus precatorius TaxID=3816 RepID=A0A8B8K401_ABRPR|nr:uncharacterized protein LOC113852348 [Abrus precatorius]